ncbi:ABC transporter ATP-binding protein [Lachnospiraceae bacterium]|jgi:putative ABC transport system ATP-binding protein|nr:ABC transporter ATP-binding protein [uncultured Schaedlerella sp.]MCI9153506.1 ABC transporter ATP-binding protein [Ruminococcus sp.]NBI57255.1 ABC transporter ATP-binding protein [Lachnospiraceae bacterium]
MLQVKHLSKSYSSGNQVYPVLKDVSLEVEKGEFVAVMGPSGSGKTTLLNCISCFVPHDQGEISLAGHDISHLKETELARVRNRQMGFVFQDFMLLDGLSIFENICLPQIIARRPVLQMEEKAKNICRLFGIEKIMDKYPAEVSGGEKQRTAVARALMNQPYVILADEPTGNLDSKSCKAVIDAFLQAKKEMGATIFMVTHDSFAASFCDRVVVLKDGRIYGELTRSGARREFMDELLNTIRTLSDSRMPSGRTLGGDSDDHE